MMTYPGSIPSLVRTLGIFTGEEVLPGVLKFQHLNFPPVACGLWRHHGESLKALIWIYVPLWYGTVTL